MDSGQGMDENEMRLLLSEIKRADVINYVGRTEVARVRLLIFNNGLELRMMCVHWS